MWTGGGRIFLIDKSTCQNKRKVERSDNMFKTTMNKLMLGFYLALFLLCINVNYVYAKNKVTQTLDLTNHQTENKLEEEGWSWDNETKILTLEDTTFEMTDTDSVNPCIKFLKSDNITVIFEGVNNLTADKESVFYGTGEKGGTLTFKSINNGKLNLNIKTYYTTNGGNNGDTIHYPYNLNIESGTINSNGGFIVDGVVTISGGNLNIDASNFTKSKGIYALRQVNITGGNVDIKSNGSAIMVTGISGESDYPDGVIISGGNINLTAIDERNPSIHAGYSQHKNIIIDGGNITLNSDFGIYTADGIISVNNVDSFNADNVRLDVFKIGNKEENKINIKDADYSEVDEAIAKANALNKDDYEDFSAVIAAINAVVKDKSVLEQSEVDAMAFNINNAIANLILKSEPQPQEPEKSDTPAIDNVDNPDTYDGILKYIIYLTLSAVGIGSSLFLYKKESINY